MAGSGRLLGLDFGSVRVGLAISDADRMVASPLATYLRQSRDADARYFRRLVHDEAVAEIVVGLPVHLDGREGQKARETRAYGQWLAEITGLTVIFWDERFSTVEAEQALLAAGMTNKRRRARRDRVAAQFVLQSYLDAGCPGEQPIRGLDEEPNDDAM